MLLGNRLDKIETSVLKLIKVFLQFLFHKTILFFVQVFVGAVLYFYLSYIQDQFSFE